MNRTQRGQQQRQSKTSKGQWTEPNRQNAMGRVSLQGVDEAHWGQSSGQRMMDRASLAKHKTQCAMSQAQ